MAKETVGAENFAHDAKSREQREVIEGFLGPV